MKRVLFAVILGVALVSPAAADFRSGLDAYERGDYAASLGAWEPLAEAGDAKAQFNLGRLHEAGKGVRPDIGKAFIWYMRAARQNHQQAEKAAARLKRRHPETARRALIEERQRAELRRLEQERRKAKAEEGGRARQPGRRSRGRKKRAGDELSLPVPAGWTVGERPVGAAITGIGDLLRIKTDKKLFLPPGETAENWSEIIFVEQFPKPAGWAPQGLYQVLIRDVIAGCDDGDGPEPSNSGKTGHPTVQSFYACTNHKDEKYGSFTMMKVIEGDEGFYLVRRLWRGAPYPKDETESVAGRFENWPAWFDRVAVTAPGAAPENQKDTRGFGFFVSRQGHIVTPYEVIKDCSRFIFSSFPARLLASNPVINLALFKSRRKPAHVGVFRAGAEVGKGDPIIVAGYPEEGSLAPELSVSAGVVGAIAGPGGDSRLLAVTAPIQPGTSGAPLLDLEGNVAGMIMAKGEAVRMAGAEEPAAKDMGFALNARVVKEFLKSQGVAFATAAGKPLTPADAGERARTFTVAVECR
jgi:S1-C subfamily serine protease